MYSSEWGFSKLLRWLRHNPEKRPQFASAFEHCDMVAETLCGVRDPKKVKRSICAMGHKWLWNASLGGLPPEQSWTKVDPLLAGVREKLDGEYATSETLAGTLSPHWVEQLGLRASIPIPVGAFDAHWDAIGAGCRTDDRVNGIGTSTCIIGITPSVNLVPGVCGVVQGSVHPRRTGIEVGLSAVGDIFNAIAVRAGTDVPTLSRRLENYQPGQTGLLPYLGERRSHCAGKSEPARSDSGVEHAKHGAGRTVRRDRRDCVPHARNFGPHGQPRRRDQAGDQCGWDSTEERCAESHLRERAGTAGARPREERSQPGIRYLRISCRGDVPVSRGGAGQGLPDVQGLRARPEGPKVYDELYPLYRDLYFALGEPGKHPLAKVLPTLIRIAEQAHQTQMAMM
ncbi:MAG TPA: hypothetical protein VK466_05970 [Terriglobales bacterium]|nr:hypothetical protein [Terriglobales bacterium]